VIDINPDNQKMTTNPLAGTKATWLNQTAATKSAPNIGGNE